MTVKELFDKLEDWMEDTVLEVVLHTRTTHGLPEHFEYTIEEDKVK